MDFSDVPEELRSTCRLLLRAYPRGIPEQDYYPLLAIMKKTGMSDRSAASAIAAFKGGDYLDFLYDVAHVLPNREVLETEVERVRAVLEPHGFDEWAAED